MDEELDLSALMNKHNSPLAEKPATSGTEAMPAGENRYLYQPEQGLVLCASLLSNSTEQHLSEALDKFRDIVEQRFLPLSETDENTTGAKAYADLLRLQQRMAQMASFPALEQARTVAVGGAFSAGKSRFLNAVIGCPSLLPTDTTPTTSIPTYLFKGQKDGIEALNVYRHKTPIDEEALKAICHAFHERFQVSFSHLLQLIAVERQQFPYQHLIFLDTPGYSKHDNRNNHVSDASIAREHLRNADFLLWLVDAQNGTIPKQDIDFLSSLDLQHPPLIIFNKAEKMLPQNREKLLEQARRDLEKSAQVCQDVIAYSAATGEEYSGNGKVLSDFLQGINSPRAGSPLGWQLQQIFRRYNNAYDSQKQTLELTWQTVNEVLFDEKLEAQHKKHLQDLRNKTNRQIDHINQQKKIAAQIAADCEQQLHQLCGQLGISLADEPEKLHLQAAGAGSSKKRSTVQAITVEALLSGDISQLAHLNSLAALPGQISRAGPVGWHISLNEPVKFEIFIMKLQITRLLNAAQIQQYVATGVPVTVKIVNDKRAEITINPNA